MSYNLNIIYIISVLFQLLGDLLEDSGWTNALVQATIASYGTADSFIRASRVTKTRHAHQFTAATLHTLLKQAHSKDCTPDDGKTTQPDDEAFEEWCTQRAKASVHFDYWLKTLSLEGFLLVYILSLREGNFELYVQSLAQIMPWVFL